MGFILMVSQRLRNDLMEVATIDVLTRIPNRRATQGFLEKEISRLQRNQSEFSVLLIDIDNFRVKVNFPLSSMNSISKERELLLQSVSESFIPPSLPYSHSQCFLLTLPCKVPHPRS